MENIRENLTNLMQLQEHPGWKHLAEEMQGEFTSLDDILHGGKIPDGMTLNEVRERYIGVAIAIKKLPLLIESYQQVLAQTDIDVKDFDPYNTEAGTPA